MKKFYVVLLLFLTLSGTTHFAQSRGFGLGVIIRSPTGISAKYWTSGTNAFDFGLGYSFEKKSRMHLHGDYLFHSSDMFQTSENIALYYGPGLRMKFKEDEDARIGFRGVLGLVWIPRGSKVDVFIEIAPVMDLIPATEFSMNGGIGFRFFFN